MTTAELRHCITQSNYVVYHWWRGSDYVVGAHPQVGNAHRHEVVIRQPRNEEAALFEGLAQIAKEIVENGKPPRC